MSDKAPRNRAQCRKCGDVVESKHRHDLVRCRCNAIFVDGGADYRRAGGSPDDFLWLGDDDTPAPGG